MLNKQGPCKIDWTDYSWNPISGCKHDCDYCYMIRMNKRFNKEFTPKFHPERLKEIQKIQEPSKIFVGSSGDMLGDWVKSADICAVLDVVNLYPEHTFQFLTKNPKRYEDFIFPKNAWLGTTVDGTDKTITNLATLALLENDNLKFVSFEPLLKSIPESLFKYFDRIDWVIIGADSNPGARSPPMDWAESIIRQARLHKTPVFVKDNYHYPKRIKEFPE